MSEPTTGSAADPPGGGSAAVPVFRSGDGPYDPQEGRGFHRLTTTRSTDLVIPHTRQIADLYLGRLTPFYGAGGHRIESSAERCWGRSVGNSASTR
jgi:hypothetical protein